MPTPDIIVTAPLPPFLYDPLRADYRCHDYAKADDKPAFLAASGGIVRALVQGGGTVTLPTLLDALPKLEIISVFGVGYDGVPVDYCRKRGIKVTNTPDVLTDDVADVAVALGADDGSRLRARQPLRPRRRVAQEGARADDQACRQDGRNSRPGPHRQAIATRLAAMGMQIAYCGRKPQDVSYRYVADLKALAVASDFLIVACPGGAATRDIVNAEVAGRARQEGHARQHRPRLDRRRARARVRAAERRHQGRRPRCLSPTNRTFRRRS